MAHILSFAGGPPHSVFDEMCFFFQTLLGGFNATLVERLLVNCCDCRLNPHFSSAKLQQVKWQAKRNTTVLLGMVYLFFLFLAKYVIGAFFSKRVYHGLPWFSGLGMPPDLAQAAGVQVASTGSAANCVDVDSTY